MAEYKIQIPVFEGPLDLLLYLIKKEEVDIYQVNLAHIAAEFIEHLEQMRKMDLDVAGEFVVMAATLIWIKSKELLPVEQRPQILLEDQDEVDPRWELIRKLVEYKKFKEAAGELQIQEAVQEDVFEHQFSKQIFPQLEEDQALRVSLVDLLKAVNGVLEKIRQKGAEHEIVTERWTVHEKIVSIQKFLQEKKKICFTELIHSESTRFEVVVIFLAILELTRLRLIRIEQKVRFGEIDIVDAVEAV